MKHNLSKRRNQVLSWVEVQRWYRLCWIAGHLGSCSSVLWKNSQLLHWDISCFPKRTFFPILPFFPFPSAWWANLHWLSEALADLQSLSETYLEPDCRSYVISSQIVDRDAENNSFLIVISWAFWNSFHWEPELYDSHSIYWVQIHLGLLFNVLCQWALYGTLQWSKCCWARQPCYFRTTHILFVLL